MAYTKQTVSDGQTITADWGNHIQTQYDEAIAYTDLVTELIASMPVAAGASITAGDVVAFTSDGIKRAERDITAGTPIQVSTYGTTYGMRCCALSATSGVIAFQDENDSNHCKAVAFSISGTTITLGSIVKLMASPSSNVQIAQVLGSTTQAIVYYTVNRNIYASVLNVSGTTITPVAAVAVTSSSNAATIGIPSPLSASNMLLPWTDMQGHPQLIVIKRTGDTITFGTSIEVMAQNNGAMATARLTNTKALVMFTGYTGQSGFAMIATVSGSTVTCTGTDNTFYLPASSPTPILWMRGCRLDLYRVLVLYLTTQQELHAAIATFSFSPEKITFEADWILSPKFSSDDVSMTKINDTRILLVGHSSSDQREKAMIIEVSGRRVSPLFIGEWGASKTGSAPTTGVALSESLAIGCYIDRADSNKMKAVALTLPTGEIIGIAKETKAAGETCKVSLGPVYKGLSGLTAGKPYFVDSSGHLSLTAGEQKMGVAISATELMRTY
jgi:hypothetical protein